MITTNTSVGSTYCGSEPQCKSTSWGTFAIQNPKKSYRYLKIKLKTPSDDFDCILLAGFEIFGIYSKTGIVPAQEKQRNTFPIVRRFSIRILMLFSLIYTY